MIQRNKILFVGRGPSKDDVGGAEAPDDVGGPEAPYFRRYGRELVSKPAIPLKKCWGGGTEERLIYSIHLTSCRLRGFVPSCWGYFELRLNVG